MITEIKIRRITCDRCNSSYEYEVAKESKVMLHDRFTFLSSSETTGPSTWDLCHTCYMSFLAWINFDDTKTRPEKLRGSDNG